MQGREEGNKIKSRIYLGGGRRRGAFTLSTRRGAGASFKYCLFTRKRERGTLLLKTVYERKSGKGDCSRER